MYMNSVKRREAKMYDFNVPTEHTHLYCISLERLIINRSSTDNMVRFLRGHSSNVVFKNCIEQIQFESNRNSKFNQAKRKMVLTSRLCFKVDYCYVLLYGFVYYLYNDVRSL